MKKHKREHLLYLIKLNKSDFIQTILEYENINKISNLSSMQLSIYLIEIFTQYGEEKTNKVLDLIFSKIN